ncbi:MAG: helix-turn-helix domain-containing protein [Oscillospiraceae bacterium]|nr:helix-turn-helix domain-containing protein [Oscillospiraceae bacterium]
MTDEQKSKINDMRTSGHSYAEIADALGISRDTIKKHCQRHPIPATPTAASDALHCKSCGAGIPIVQGRKQPQFCSTECRRAWWKAHPDSGTRKAYYTIVCAGCGQEFQSYGNAGRKYCSHDCYIRSRFKGGVADE